MTWLEFMQKYDNTITHDEAECYLWEWTAFPMSGIRMTVKQLLSAIRARKTKIIICWECGQTKPFHKKYCSSFKINL